MSAKQSDSVVTDLAAIRALEEAAAAELAEIEAAAAEFAA